MWLGRTIWPKSEGGLAFNKMKMDHLYELRDLIQTNSQHIRAVVVERRPSSFPPPYPTTSTIPSSSSSSSLSGLSSSSSGTSHFHPEGGGPVHNVSGSTGLSSSSQNRLYSMLRVLKRRDQSQQHGTDEWIRCLQEAVQLHQRIEHHPHVIRIHQVYEDEEELCVLTDHVRGTRLYDELLRRGKFTEAEVLPLVKQLLYIASCLHSHGVGMTIRPDTVFVEDSADGTCANGETARFPLVLSLPDLFLVIARNLANERNVNYEDEFSFGMSAPFGYFAPEVIECEQKIAPNGTTLEASGDTSSPLFTTSGITLRDSSDASKLVDPSKVDMWQIGIIAYLLLSGGTCELPFLPSISNETDDQPERALGTDDEDGIISSPRPDFSQECWADISETAKNFLQSLLANDPMKRPTPRQALRHPWLCGKSVTMLEDICIDAIVDNVDLLGGCVERLPKFLLKKVTKNTINYRGLLPPHRRNERMFAEDHPLEQIALQDSDSTPLLPLGGDLTSDQRKALGLTDLVAELLLNVFSFLVPADLLRVSQVCHQLYELSSDNFLWKRLCLDEVGAVCTISEEQVRQITYDNLESQLSSTLSSPSPLFRAASALKRRKKNKKKGKDKHGRNSDYALLVSMDKYVWKYFYFFGMPCFWNSCKKHETIEFVDGDPRTARKAQPELWCTVIGNKIMKKGVHSWTIDIAHTSLGDIMLGVCKPTFDPSGQTSYVSDKAWLYHINQRNVYHSGSFDSSHVISGTSMPFVGGPMPGGVEVRYVTCTLNLDEGTLAISVNDHDLGVIVRHLEGEFCPAVDIFNTGDTVIFRSFTSAFSLRNSKVKDNASIKRKDLSQETMPNQMIDMSVSGRSMNNGLPSVCVTKKFWNSRKTVHFTSCLKQSIFHPGSPIDIAVSIDNRSSKTIRCLIISFRGTKGKKAIPMGYSHTSFSSTEGTISFPIEGRRKEEGTFTVRLPVPVGFKKDSCELHLELPIRGHSSIKAVLPLPNIHGGYRTSTPSSSSSSASSLPATFPNSNETTKRL